MDCQDCTHDICADTLPIIFTIYSTVLHSYLLTTLDVIDRAALGQGDEQTIDIGRPGSGSRLHAVAEFNIPRGLHASPWCLTCVLVADSGNNRVLEVDVQSGLLTKVRPRHRVLFFSSP